MLSSVGFEGQNQRSARTLSPYHIPIRLLILAFHDPSLHPATAGRYLPWNK
jgi:hypothetical protein